MTKLHSVKRHRGASRLAQRAASVARWVGRVVATGKVLARDSRIPRWLRWLFVFGVMPVPLFLDELALVLAVGLLLVGHRRLLAEAWRTSQ